MCGVSFNFMQNKEEKYLYFKNDFYYLTFDKNLSSVENNDKYVNLCLLFGFACEIRSACHANKSLSFTWKRFLILDGGKVLLMYTVSQKVLQINQNQKKKKQD